jgi:hypothetical protein
VVTLDALLNQCALAQQIIEAVRVHAAPVPRALAFHSSVSL